MVEIVHEEVVFGHAYGEGGPVAFLSVGVFGFGADGVSAGDVPGVGVGDFVV